MEFEAQRTGLTQTWHIVTRAVGEARRDAIVSMLPHDFGEDEETCRDVAAQMNLRWPAPSVVET